MSHAVVFNSYGPGPSFLELEASEVRAYEVGIAENPDASTAVRWDNDDCAALVLLSLCNPDRRLRGTRWDQVTFSDPITGRPVTRQIGADSEFGDDGRAVLTLHGPYQRDGSERSCDAARGSPRHFRIHLPTD